MTVFPTDRSDKTVIETVLKTMFLTDRSDKTVTETVLSLDNVLQW